jgi:hypothetical protein
MVARKNEGFREKYGRENIRMIASTMAKRTGQSISGGKVRAIIAT